MATQNDGVTFFKGCNECLWFGLASIKDLSDLYTMQLNFAPKHFYVNFTYLLFTISCYN